MISYKDLSTGLKIGVIFSYTAGAIIILSFLIGFIKGVLIGIGG